MKHYQLREDGSAPPPRTDVFGDVVPVSFFEVNKTKNGLNIYGAAFEVFTFDPAVHKDREKFNQSLVLVESIAFKYVAFDKVVAQIPKLKKFSKLARISFSFNNIHSLNQMDELVPLGVEELAVKNNSICDMAVYR
jgi:hypothetical protein